MANTGATVHVTSRRDLFPSYTMGEFGSLKMVNNDVSKVVGMDDICLKMSSGSKLLLKDVRRALDICLNLISVRKLDDDGFGNDFGDGKWKLSKGVHGYSSR